MEQPLFLIPERGRAADGTYPDAGFMPPDSPALVFRKNGNGPHAQHLAFLPVICPDNGFYMDDVPDNAAAMDGDHIQFRDEGGAAAHDMEQVMLIAAGGIMVPERFPCDVLRFGMVGGLFRS